MTETVDNRVNGMQTVSGITLQPEPETVDKTLIERLILEHSDRLELEINQKARADAWKFYFRVRVDHVVRPFAVCKVCYRVLHCDSRSGTASLLRHPCNPLSERSPVNRAVKLSAKLNLPSDNLTKNNIFKDLRVDSQDTVVRQNLRNSPLLAGLGSTKSTCSSPISTGSPPAASQPAFSASISVPTNNNISSNNGGRKRKAGAPSPVFPLDLRLLQLPQVMAAVAAHPLAALNLANATAILSDPQHFQQLQQQQQMQLEHLIREHQQNLQERENKRNKEDDAYHDSAGSPTEANSSYFGWNSKARVKKERVDAGEDIINYNDEAKDFSYSSRGINVRDEQEKIIPLNKEAVQHLVSINSPRVFLTDKDSAGAHYISDVWSRFQVVFVDGTLRPFAACRICRKVVTYTKYSGTGGLLRHRCSPQEARHLNSPSQENSTDLMVTARPTLLASRENYDRMQTDPHNYAFSPHRKHSREEFPLKMEGTPVAQTAAMSGIATAMLRYICHDLVFSSTVDTPAFHQMVHNVMNLGAAHGSLRHGEGLPSSKELLNNFLQPLVSDSKDVIVKYLQDEKYLCISLDQKQNGDSEMIGAALHCINENFELQNHSIGTRNLYKGESREEAVKDLLKDFFKSVLPPMPLMEKFVTVVADNGDLSGFGSASVQCLWHTIETIMKSLSDLPAYNILCDEIRSNLSCLAESGFGDGTILKRLHLAEINSWDGLLHAVTFILRQYDEIKTFIDKKALNRIKTPPLNDKELLAELQELFIGIQRCVMTVRDHKRPTLNQVVFCRAKLLQLCSTASASSITQQIKENLSSRLESDMVLAPLHLVASFLDPRCKSLKVLSESEKNEVHRFVLEMMKAVSVTEANSGVLNLKTYRRNCSPPPLSMNPPTTSVHPFSEYMDIQSGADISVSDSEEIMAYVNLKVQLEGDDILTWWGGPSSSGLPTLRRLARKLLAVPATCTFASQINNHAVAAAERMGIEDQSLLNSVLHMKYNIR